MFQGLVLFDIWWKWNPFSVNVNFSEMDSWLNKIRSHKLERAKRLLCRLHLQAYDARWRKDARQKKPRSAAQLRLSSVACLVCRQIFIFNYETFRTKMTTLTARLNWKWSPPTNPHMPVIVWTFQKIRKRKLFSLLRCKLLQRHCCDFEHEIRVFFQTSSTKDKNKIKFNLKLRWGRKCEECSEANSLKTKVLQLPEGHSTFNKAIACHAGRRGSNQDTTKDLKCSNPPRYPTTWPHVLSLKHNACCHAHQQE